MVGKPPIHRANMDFGRIRLDPKRAPSDGGLGGRMSLHSVSTLGLRAESPHSVSALGLCTQSPHSVGRGLFDANIGCVGQAAGNSNRHKMSRGGGNRNGTTLSTHELAKSGQGKKTREKTTPHRATEPQSPIICFADVRRRRGLPLLLRPRPCTARWLRLRQTQTDAWQANGRNMFAPNGADGVRGPLLVESGPDSWSLVDTRCGALPWFAACGRAAGRRAQVACVLLW
jgi:hypothetical protein